MSKKNTDFAWWEIILIVFAVPLFVLLIILLGVFYFLPTYILVDRPIIKKLSAERPRWKKWWEIRNETGVSTKQITRFLHLYSMPDSLLECRLRPANEVKRIESLYYISPPRRVKYPLSPYGVIYFEYRLISGGHMVRKVMWNRFTALAPRLQTA